MLQFSFIHDPDVTHMVVNRSHHLKHRCFCSISGCQQPDEHAFGHGKFHYDRLQNWWFTSSCILYQDSLFMVWLCLGLLAIRSVNVLFGCLFQGPCCHFGIMISYVLVCAYHQTRVCYKHCKTLVISRCVRLICVNNATHVHVCLCQDCHCLTVC
jgi:hypothetical protein